MQGELPLFSQGHLRIQVQPHPSLHHFEWTCSTNLVNLKHGPGSKNLLSLLGAAALAAFSANISACGETTATLKSSAKLDPRIKGFRLSVKRNLLTPVTHESRLHCGYVLIKSKGSFWEEQINPAHVQPQRWLMALKWAPEEKEISTIWSIYLVICVVPCSGCHLCSNYSYLPASVLFFWPFSMLGMKFD